MVKLDRIKRGIERSVRKRSVEHDWSRSRTLRHDKGFYAETTDEPFMADAVFVGLDIALVPGKAKRRLRYLDDEEIKVSVGREPPYFDVHDFDWTDGFDFYTALRVSYFSSVFRSLSFNDCSNRGQFFAACDTDCDQTANTIQGFVLGQLISVAV